MSNQRKISAQRERELLNDDDDDIQILETRRLSEEEEEALLREDNEDGNLNRAVDSGRGNEDEIQIIESNSNNNNNVQSANQLNHASNNEDENEIQFLNNNNEEDKSNDNDIQLIANNEDEDDEEEIQIEQQIITVNDEEEEKEEEKGKNGDDVQVIGEGEGNEEASNPPSNTTTPQNLCQKCNKQKIYRFNLCYRCRGFASAEQKRMMSAEMKGMTPTTSSGGVLSRSQRYKQSDEEFLQKCLEVRGKRRVSHKPLTFTEEYILSPPKRQRPLVPKLEPKLTRQSLPSMNFVPSNVFATTTFNVKQEPGDEFLPDPLNDALPDLTEEPIKLEPREKRVLGPRIRECSGCHQVKKHHARNLCGQCYNKWNEERRKSQPGVVRRSGGGRRNLPARMPRPMVVKDEDVQEVSARSNIRECATCFQMTPHYARGRCRQCYFRFTSYCRRFKISVRETPIDSVNFGPSATAPAKKEEGLGCKNCGQPVYSLDLCRSCYQEDVKQAAMDFSNYRVCQECKEYRLHHCRGMCRSCYEHDLKVKKSGPSTSNNNAPRVRFASNLVVEKRRTVIPLVSQVVQVKEEIPDEPIPSSSSSSFNLPPLSSFSLVSPPINASNKRPTKSSITNCVVCSVLLEGEALWPGSIVCRKCHGERKQRHRWCISCNQLKVHDGGGKCRPCNLASKGRLSPNKLMGDQVKMELPPTRQSLPGRLGVQKSSFQNLRPHPSQSPYFNQSGQITHCVVCRNELDFSILTRNAKICMDCRDKGLQKMRWCLDCKQLKLHQGRGRCADCYLKHMKMLNSMKLEENNANNEVFDSPVVQQQSDEIIHSNTDNILSQVQAIYNQLNKGANLSSTTRPATTNRHSFPATNLEIRNHQEHLRQTDTLECDCLICHNPIDFKIQSKNSKICVSCREKGYQRLRWCIDCKKLKHSQSGGRCQECHRLFLESGGDVLDNDSGTSTSRNSTTSRNSGLPGNSGLSMSNASGLSTFPGTSRSSGSVSATANIVSKPTPSLSSTTKKSTVDAQQTLLDQLNAIFSQFNAATSSGEGEEQQPQSSRLSLPANQQQESRSRIDLSKSLTEKVKLELPSNANCVICQSALNFRKQARGSKVCLECKSKNLGKHRFCLDCNQLKLCIGRGRCSPCYTIFMKNFNAQKRHYTPRGSGATNSATNQATNFATNQATNFATNATLNSATIATNFATNAPNPTLNFATKSPSNVPIPRSSLFSPRKSTSPPKNLATAPSSSGFRLNPKFKSSLSQRMGGIDGPSTSRQPEPSTSSYTSPPSSSSSSQIAMNLVAALNRLSQTLQANKTSKTQEQPEVAQSNRPQHNPLPPPPQQQQPIQRVNQGPINYITISSGEEDN